jgi:hypothetical protein
MSKQEGRLSLTIGIEILAQDWRSALMTAPNENDLVDQEETADEASPRTKWLCDIALKRLEATQKDFDTLNSRSGVVIGFAGLFNSLLLPSWARLDQNWKVPTGLGWIATAGFMLFFAFSAYGVREIDNIPLLKATRVRYYALTDEDARDQFTSDCIQAADRNERRNNLKAYDLKIAIYALAVQIILSIIVIILGGLATTP